MEKGKILGEAAPSLPKYLVDELELINRDLRWMWMPDNNCWAVVTPGPLRASGKNYWIEALLLGDKGQPLEPSMDIIRYLRKLKWEAAHMTDEQILADVDQKEKDLIEKAEEERRWLFHDFSKKVYKFLHSKTFS